MPDNRNNDEIGACWLKESKANTKYFSGQIDLSKVDLDKLIAIAREGGKLKFVIFRNHNKRSPKAPDYVIIGREIARGGSGAEARPVVGDDQRDPGPPPEEPGSADGTGGSYSF